MNKTLTLQLQQKYPKLLSDLYGEPTTTFLDNGIDVGDGWYDILDYVFHSIENFKQTFPTNYVGIDNDIVIYNIKTNLNGMLEIQFHGNDEDGLIKNVLIVAKALSNTTCQTCGGRRNNINPMENTCVCKKTED